MATIITTDGALDQRGKAHDGKLVPFTKDEAERLVREKNRRAEDLGVKVRYLVGADDVPRDINERITAKKR